MELVKTIHEDEDAQDVPMNEDASAATPNEGSVEEVDNKVRERVVALASKAWSLWQVDDQNKACKQLTNI